MRVKTSQSAGEADPNGIEVLGDGDLAGQARMLLTMKRAVEQIGLILAGGVFMLSGPDLTKTWQVAQEQQPPHSASRSSKPWSRSTSIRVMPGAAETCVPPRHDRSHKDWP
jgi:hypothetical protein